MTRAQIFFVLLTSICTFFIARHYVKRYYQEQVQAHVRQSLGLLELALVKSPGKIEDWCASYGTATDYRLTLINEAGMVVCDSKVMNRSLENHGNRPEILIARNKGIGFSFRESSTLGKTLFYGAKRVNLHGQELFVREALDMRQMFSSLHKLDKATFSILLPILFAFTLLAIAFGVRASSPLQMLLGKVREIEDRLPFETSLKLMYRRDEWETVEAAIDRVKTDLENQITDLRTENDKITTLLESIDDAIFAIDKFDRILFTNEKFKNLFKGHDFDGPVFEIIPEDIHQKYQECIELDEPTRIRSYEFEGENEKELYYNITITTLKNSIGDVIGALGVYHDITRQRLIEKMRVDFVANVSHELRTPLTSIKGFAQLLQTQKAEIPQSSQDYVDKILINSERLLAIFQDLLKLSIIESTRELEWTRVNLTELFSKVYNNVKQNYAEIDSQWSEDLDVVNLGADVSLLEQAVTNIVDNAFKYSTDGTVNLKFSSREVVKGVIVSISDSGTGIPQHKLKRVFERFYRVDSARSSEVKGTGIGLSIVKHIVKKHGGKVWVESELNQGSTFYLFFPFETDL